MLTQTACFTTMIGIYYHMGKRAAGIRYIFTGRPTQQRPRYDLMTLTDNYLVNMTLRQ